MCKRIEQYTQEELEQGAQETTKSVFRFAGWTNTRDILGISDILVLLATNDGFALSVLEAFHMDVLVARTKTAGFDDQRFCLPISGDDPSDIANLITEVALNGTGKWRDLIEQAHEYALEEFTIERMVDKTLKVYERAMKKHR